MDSFSIALRNIDIRLYHRDSDAVESEFGEQIPQGQAKPSCVVIGWALVLSASLIKWKMVVMVR